MSSWTGMPDLGLHDVDAGDLLGHRVLDLDARIDLDEVEAVRIQVVEELDGPGAAIAAGPAQAHRVVGQLGPAGFVEVGRRRALDDLLIAPLDRAVPFEEVDQVAVAVADDLDLDVARPADQLLQEDLVVAEGGLGLAAAGLDLLVQIAGALDHPHAPAAAAPARLEHQRIADLLGDARGRVRIAGQGRACGDHGNAGPGRQRPGLDLAAQLPHDLGRRADESDAVGGAGLGQLRLLR
jgi:hypothetical protein